MFKYHRRLLLAAFCACILAACSQAEDSPAQSMTDKGPALTDIVLGEADAPVTLIEYASWTCPACLQFHEDVIPMLKSEYIETGKVRLIFREFPTPPASLSVVGFTLARCAGAENYFTVLDDLFANQTRILNLIRSGGDVEKAMRDIGAAHGQSGTSYDACLQDEAVRSAIIDAVTRGDSEGVTSTPTLFINGQKIPGFDWRNADGMRKVLEAALNT